MNHTKTESTVQKETSAWPVDGLEALGACPNCGSRNRELLYKGLVDRIFFCAPGHWNMFKCGACICAYLDPRPTQATIGIAYERYFTHNEASGFSSLGYLGKIRRVFANGYRNFRFGTNDKPASKLGIFVSALVPNGRAVIDAGMRHLPKALPGQRLLDVGCGSSVFLARARSAGWDVVGADFDPKAVDAARSSGLDVRLGGVEVFDPDIDQFDVITLAHVVEHVHQPLDLLKSCYDLLKPGGFLWLETPNITSQGHRQFGRNWRGLEPPRHLVIFGHLAMQNALRAAGFEKIELQPYRPLCRSLFQASTAISEGRDPYTESENRPLLGLVRKAENAAYKDPEIREFITLKAWKKQDVK